MAVAVPRDTARDCDPRAASAAGGGSRGAAQRRRVTRQRAGGRRRRRHRSPYLARRDHRRPPRRARIRLGARVLSLGPCVQVVLATAPVDLRRGHDGLVTLVRSLWHADPYSGTLFVFFGRRRDCVKVLFFSAGGPVVSYKRLERGGFCISHAPETSSHIELDAASLAMLLDGIDLRVVRSAPRWEPKREKRRIEGRGFQRAS